MNSEIETFKTMGKKIREVEDRLLEDAEILGQTKERLSFDPTDYKRRSDMRPTAIAGLVATAAAVVLWMVLSGPKTITIRMDGRPIQTGEWISSSKGEPVALAFSDGSSVWLKEFSGLRVRDLTSNGARLLLERGALEARVMHRETTNWKLDVGPYLITVVGTRFHVSWNPETEELRLKMKQGSVRVEGPMIPAGTVEQGQTLSASLSDGTVKIHMDDPSRAVSADSRTISPAPLNSTAAASRIEKEAPFSNDKSLAADPSAALPRKSEPFAAPIRRNDWRKLADSGRFADAVKAAEQIGIDKILSESSAVDLLSLGNAARHEGSFAAADRVYKAARKRFPATAYSSGAAFALGLMAFDQQKDYIAAARWFSASLNDRSHDTLSQEALGRLMEALRLSGDTAAAKKAAGRYLAEYPNGPHAALARRTIEQQ